MNFNLEAGSSQSTVVTQLPGNAIHTVTFVGVEAKEIESKTTQEKYKILSIKFKSADGTFEDTIFEPKPGDDVRVKNQWGYESPAPAEEIAFKIKHLIAAVNPKVGAQIEKSGIQVSGWDQFRDFAVKHTKDFAGKTELQIKLLSRTNAKGVTNAQFPSFVLGINKEGKAYPRTNFIGQKLAFTPKELEKINNAKTATPSNPDKLITVDIPELKAEDLDDLNFKLL